MTAIALLLLAPQSQAYSTGKTGSSVSGCTACHGKSADTTTSATLFTPLMIVAPGDTIDVDLTVATTDTARENAGLDVSVTGGTLQSGINTQASSGEITHNAPEPLSTGSAIFEFRWIAPSQEGDYTFYAAGNAVNGNGNNSGDGWNTTTMTITVDDGCDDLDGDSVSDCDGDCNDDDDTVFPGAQEYCNGVDQNCDGVPDNDAVDAMKVFEDIDGDSYGNSKVISIGCDGNGYSVEGGDCDDVDPTSYPGAEEVANDGIDQDCDGEDLLVEGGDSGSDSGTTPGGNDSGEEGDTGEGDKNGSTCSVISGMFGMGAVWLGLMGILRRRDGEE